jgi:hypothetical protein
MASLIFSGMDANESNSSTSASCAAREFICHDVLAILFDKCYVQS